MQQGQRRVLGSNRSAAEAVSSAEKTKEVMNLIMSISKGLRDDYTLRDLERALSFFTSHNSSYTNVDSDDFQGLLDEVLNNHIRSILVFADFSPSFADEEVYSLSMMFQYNLSVEALTLSGINVSDESISTLCEALVHSRVNFIDFSNTPLEDEAGHSLAALARVNTYLRTVIVDDTLITGDILDEIDVACQYNQSNFEANADLIDETLLREGDIGKLKRRLQQAVRAQQRKVHYCVSHVFGVCQYGADCIFSHALSSSGVDDSKGGLSDKITKLFSSGGNWEEKLLQPPQEGAAWRGRDDSAEQSEVRLNLNKRLEIKKRIEDEKMRKRNRRAAACLPTGGGQRSSLYVVLGASVGVAVAATLVGLSLYVRRQR